ncbi:uracil-DNA glycosylase [Candidatus Woesearchaeota archaeon]|nr:uracil-DNA glycosylase [Candidatus Woesearchaeota archaeon]
MGKKNTLQKIAEKIKRCKSCRLYKTANKAVPGQGPYNASIMIIGMAPGKKEDLTGTPFVGRAGKFLDYLLEKNRIDRKKIFITSIIKHHPPKNRLPKVDEITACLSYTIEQIKTINPKTIVLLGNVARKYIPKEILKKKKVISTYHPAAGMRFPKIRKKILMDFGKLKNSKTKPLKNRKK